MVQKQKRDRNGAIDIACISIYISILSVLWLYLMFISRLIRTEFMNNGRKKRWAAIQLINLDG